MGGHCVLPIGYDFFSDYKALQMHVWFEAKERRKTQESNPYDFSQHYLANSSNVDWAVGQYLDAYNDILGPGGVKILHWPGEFRKPWQRWRRAIMSPWDEEWWDVHDEMCRASAAPCQLKCNTPVDAYI